jgi:hypothetical protein
MTIWGHHGDWYGVDFTIGEDPVMQFEKVKVKSQPSIEAVVLAEVAGRRDVSVESIKVSHIIRMLS